MKKGTLLSVISMLFLFAACKVDFDRAIKENPELKAMDLSIKLDREKDWLKINVRKLKNLGLTISHEQGYTLSPRGAKFMKIIGE